MKISLIIIMNLIYTTRYNEEMNIPQNHSVVHNYNYTYSFIFNKLDSCNVGQLNDTHLNHKIQIDSNTNCENLFEFFDWADIPEPSIDELNKCAPVTLDYDCLNKLLDDKQEFNTSDDNTIDFDTTEFDTIDFNTTEFDTIDFNTNNDQDMKIIDESKLNFEETSVNNGEELVNNFKNYVGSNNSLTTSTVINSNLKTNDIKGEKLMWDTLRTYMKDYIILEHKMSNSYRGKYFKRLDNIDKACETFDNHTLNYEKYLSIFQSSSNLEFAEELKEIFSTLDKNTKFNRKTYKNFLNEFDKKLFLKPHTNKIRNELSFLKTDQKNLFFNYELTKLYKYVNDVPELITLGGCYSNNSDWDVLIVIHLINILFDNNITVNKTFILFMITKSFECFHNRTFDIFKITCFKIECNKNKHHLDYFPWEFSGPKRQDLGNRRNKIFKCTTQDQRDSKIVVLLHVYQIRILTKYYKISTENMELLENFICDDIVKDPKDCAGCFFNEYMEILVKIILKCFYC